MKWIGYKDPWSGIANVYVDGTLKTQVDSYSASGQAQQVLYTIAGLSSGSHTLVIEVTGTKNPPPNLPGFGWTHSIMRRNLPSDIVFKLTH